MRGRYRKVGERKREGEMLLLRTMKREKRRVTERRVIGKNSNVLI